MHNSPTETLSPMQVLERMFRVEMAYLAATTKDARMLAEAFHPDVVVHEPTSVPYPGDWRGLGGVAGLLESMDGLFSKLAVDGLSCSGSLDNLHVSCTLHMTFRATGISVTQPFAQILSFKEGRLIEATPFYFDTAEMQAAIQKVS
jgi:ketosteroid isomerase-like protein